MRKLLALLVLSSSLSAADIPVSPASGLQAAIDSAVSGDRLLLDAGTYLEQIDFNGKLIEIIGVQGAQATIIDGNGVGPVVRFAQAEGPAARLSGVTVTGGFAGFGAGGIACSLGATPTIADVIIRNNVGKFGGGVSGSPILERCAIYDNRASLSNGGGVYGAPQMSHCIVARNTVTSAHGGGLYLTGGSASITDCLIVENRTIFGGGGHGGGVHVSSTCNATFERTLIASNSASAGAFAALGSGVFVGGTADFNNCAVVGNRLFSASDSAGGIWGAATVSNSIVRDNDGDQLVGVGAVSYSNVAGGFLGAGIIDVDPAFVDSLAGDYHLLPGSACIDAGDPSQQDPDGTVSDMGAFPFQTLYTHSSTLESDWADLNAPQVSAALAGDQVRFDLLAGPQNAGRTYVVLAGLSGSTPGQTLPLGTVVPVNFDSLTNIVVNNLNTPAFSGFLGSLDSQGRASATFDTIVALGPIAIGLEVTFAYVLTLPIDFASNPVTVTVLQ